MVNCLYIVAIQELKIKVLKRLKRLIEILPDILRCPLELLKGDFRLRCIVMTL